MTAMIKSPDTLVIRFPDDENNELVFTVGGECKVYSISEEQLYYLVAVGAQRLWCLRQVTRSAESRAAGTGEARRSP